MNEFISFTGYWNQKKAWKGNRYNRMGRFMNNVDFVDQIIYILKCIRSSTGSEDPSKPTIYNP